MQLNKFLQQLNDNPNAIEFEDTMAVIAANYHYQATAFDNGQTSNAAGSNEGSCKIFAFALLNQLSVQQTLQCFGRFYHQDVLQNPAGNDHANIRNFMLTGWEGITFQQTALTAK